jgi:hypothetical protein
MHPNNNIHFCVSFFFDLFFVLCNGLAWVWGALWKSDLKIPVATQNFQGSLESNNLEDIIDIQKLKSDLPRAMKLYYSKKTAIINLPKSVKNAAIKVAKKILKY